MTDTEGKLYKLFHLQLAHVLVEMDKAEARAEMKRRMRPNIFRMGLLLEALHKAEDEATALVARGVDVHEAFLTAVTEHFTATKRMHTFLKKLDPHVDVVRGRWVYKD